MISFKTYFRRLVGIHQELELAKNALASLQETPGAVEKFARSEAYALQRLAESLPTEAASRGFATDHLMVMTELLAVEVPSRFTDLELRFRQQGIILRIAVYEAFMKEVHRAILESKPTLLNPDRKIALGLIASQGLEVVLRQEIDREVASVDRMSVTDVSEHFKERLGIEWIDPKAVEALDRSTRLRNVILHEDPLRAVSHAEVRDAHQACTVIPWFTVGQAAVLYPTAFSPAPHVDLEEIRHWISSRRKSSKAGTDSPADDG